MKPTTKSAVRRLLSRGWLPVALALCLVTGTMAGAEAFIAGGETFVDPRGEAFPFPDLEVLEPAVAEQLRQIEQILGSLDPKTDLNISGGIFADAGQIYHAYGFEPAAEACYRNAQLLLPGDYRWPYLRGFVQQQAGQLELAAASYRLALECDDSFVPALIHLAEVLQAQGELDEARQILAKALRLEPRSAAARAALGEIALAARSYQEAIEHLEQVLEQVPAANRYHYPLALAYRGLGDREAASRHLALRGEVGVQPPDSLIEGLEDLKRGERVHLLRGRRAFGAGRYAEAAAAFAEAVAARPDSARARVNLATALAFSGSRQAAVKELNEALALEPDNLTARFNLGRLMLESGQIELAIPQLRAVAEGDPKDLRAVLSLAQALRRAGHLEESLRWYGVAVELDPGQEEARLKEAAVLVDLERFREALAKLETANELMPREGRLIMALVRLLAASPDPSIRDGKRALELALAVYEAGQTVGNAELVAQALAESGRCEEAAEWQRGAVEAASKAGLASLPRMQATLGHYTHHQPCRPPAGSVE